METLTIQYIDVTWCNGRAMADETNQPGDDSNKPVETPNKKGGGGLRDMVRAESMIQLALAIPAGCLVGWAIGAWLDRHFHQDWIAVAGIVLGAVAGFVQIYRTASGFLKNDR
jgi:hypothetical protein